jgi:hypothetical protein
MVETEKSIKHLLDRSDGSSANGSWLIAVILGMGRTWLAPKAASLPGRDGLRETPGVPTAITNLILERI